MPFRVFHQSKNNVNINQDDIFIDLLLLKKCTGETLSEEEVRKLTLWLQASPDHVRYYEAMQSYTQRQNKEVAPDIENAFHAFRQRVATLVPEPSPIRIPKGNRSILWWSLSTAAALLVAIGLAITHWQIATTPQNNTVHAPAVSPLLNQPASSTTDTVVRMITEHGESIALQPNSRFEVQSEKIEVKDNTLAHQLMAPLQSKPYHVVTPKGQKFAVSLPDGTKVWLNENSQLRYTLPFSGNERRVYLDGEGYFEVAKNYAPFVVQTGSTEVKAYGTVFNVNSFDKRYVKALLVEGSIGVKSTFSDSEWMVEPGQLAQLQTKNQQISIKEVHSDDYIAWLKGEFNFQNLPLEDILESLMNHYRVTAVSYADADLRNISLSAHIKTNRSLEEVLDFLAQATGLSIVLSNAKISVEKN